MIAKISKGSGFGGAVLYALDENSENDKIVQVLDVNGLYMDIDSFNEKSKKKDGDEEGDDDFDLDIGEPVENSSEEITEESADSEDSEDSEGSSEAPAEVHDPEQKPLPPVTAALAADFNLQASMNPRVTTPVRDISLSYSPKDLPKLNDATMLRDAKAYLKGMGYDNTQYLIVRHFERDNPHVHIVANAVDFDGNKIPDKFDREKSTKICKEITLANGYTWGDHKSISEAKDIHNPIDRIKYDLSKKIVAGIEKCTSITFLPEKLAQMGVGCQVKTDSKGLPVGISFSVQAPDKKGNMREYKFAGSHIDRKFSARNIAVACELHEHMPELVRAAYQIKEDCEQHPGLLMTPGAQNEYERLRKVLSEECKERKRLDERYRDFKKNCAISIIGAFIYGTPIAAAMVGIYASLKKVSIDKKYMSVSKSIDVTLKQIRSAKTIMHLVQTEPIHRRYLPDDGTDTCTSLSQKSNNFHRMKTK